MRPVLVREHVDHASDAERIARVDARDATLAIVEGDDAAVREAGCAEFGGVFRRAGDLAGPSTRDVAVPMKGAMRSPDRLAGLDCGVPSAACVRARRPRGGQARS